jgi:hypothetical protein
MAWQPRMRASCSASSGASQVPCELTAHHSSPPHTHTRARRTHTPYTQAALKGQLLKALVEEPQKSVVHKVCDTVSELAAELLDKGEWPEVLPALQGLITSGSPCAMEAGLLILADLAGYSTDHLRPHLAGLQPLLAGCLSNSSIEVQVRCWRGSQGARGQQGRMLARAWCCTQSLTPMCLRHPLATHDARPAGCCTDSMLQLHQRAGRGARARDLSAAAGAHARSTGAQRG